MIKTEPRNYITSEEHRLIDFNVELMKKIVNQRVKRQTTDKFALLLGSIFEIDNLKICNLSEILNSKEDAGQSLEEIVWNGCCGNITTYKMIKDICELRDHE